MNILETKSYEDICIMLNIDPNLKPDVSAYHDRDKDAAVSMFRLWNANRAAWGDIEIDWNDWYQRKYQVWANLYDEAGSGAGFSYNGYDYDDGFSIVGARLVWPSPEIGEHMTEIMKEDWINVFKLPKNDKTE